LETIVEERDDDSESVDAAALYESDTVMGELCGSVWPLATFTMSVKEDPTSLAVLTIEAAQPEGL
jgi:hypothetical protein